VSDLSTSQFIRYLLSGSPTGGSANGGYGPNAFGTSGIDFANALAQAQSGGGIDPRLAQYFNESTQGSEGSNTVFNPTGSVSNQGTVMIDGIPYIQLAGATDNTTIKNRDPSMFKQDPTFGLLTPASNVMSGSDPFSDIAPILAAAGFAGPALYAAAGGLGAADNPYWSMTAANTTDVPVGSLPYSGLEGATTPAAGTFDAEGVTGLGGVNALAPHTLGGELSGLLSGNASLGSTLGGVGSTLLSGAMNNPLQALGLLQMAKGVIGSHGSTSSSSSSKGSGNGMALPSPQSRPAFMPNPYTQMAIQSLYGPGAK